MNTSSTMLVGVVCLFFACGPTGAASVPVGLNNPYQSTPTTLYFHLNSFQDFPINTQMPSDAYAEDAGFGVTTTTLTCAPDNPVTGGFTHAQYHTYYGFVSPSIVEYNFTADGKPRIHQERGLAHDVVVDFNATFNVHWFLSTQAGAPSGQDPDPNTLPIVLPQVEVRATMRTGDKISAGMAGYNSGEILAQGLSPVATLGGPLLTRGANYTQVAGQNVYEIVVPMTFAGAAILPKDKGFSLRIDVFEKVTAGVCDNPESGTLMPNLVRVHTSKDHRPRMDLSVMNPVSIEYIHPQFVDGDLVIHTSTSSPWGSYDVDATEAGLHLNISGPSEARALHRAVVVNRVHVHSYDHASTRPLDVTFVWPFKADNATNGLYTITLSVQNRQATSNATGVASFEIGKHLMVTKCGGLVLGNVIPDSGCATEEQDAKGNVISANLSSPGLQLLGGVGVVGAAAVAARRRT